MIRIMMRVTMMTVMVIQKSFEREDVKPIHTINNHEENCHTIPYHKARAILKAASNFSVGYSKLDH